MEFSEQVHRIYSEGKDIAKATGKPFGSAQLLLAVFTEEAAPNQAYTVLTDRDYGLDEDSVIEALRGLPAEPDGTMQTIKDKTLAAARACDSDMVGSLHLLLAVSQVSSAAAYQALSKLRVDLGEMRVRVFSFLTGVLPRRFYKHAREIEESTADVASSDWSQAGGADEGPVPRLDDLLEPAAMRRIAAAHTERKPLFTGGADREAATARAIAALVAGARRAHQPKPAADKTKPESRFALDPEDYPLLTGLGRNLSVEAEADKLDPLIGREDELEQVLDILHKRRANNPCVIGEPGVGKNALVEGVAARLVAEAGDESEPRIIVELNVGALVAGTQLRGAFSERMAGLREEVRKAEGRVVLFVDELHTLLGAGAGSGPLDAANELKTSLARGEFPCIGATTNREYRLHVESDAALERRFQPIVLEEPSAAEANKVVASVLPRYERHHGVRFERGCVDAAVRLSSRYIPDRRLPDKAFSLLDLAGARCARAGKECVELDDLSTVVARLTGVPVERLVLSDAERLLQMGEFMDDRVIGQEQSVERIVETIQRNSAGFRSRRPAGSFLLLGPTGVGKTETVRVLADFLFQSRDAVTRFDMSEFIEPHSVAKLIGTSPGYVGHEDGGQLTESVHRRPYQIILFDEVEKASRDVLQILLQVLEEGALHDGKGRKVDFSNTVIALTSNLGAKELEQRRSGIGFSGARSADNSADEKAERERQVLTAARKAFAPELWNRIEEKLVYHPLETDSVARISRLLLDDSAGRLKEETGIGYEADDAVIDYLIENGGYDVRYGARPMRRTIQRYVEGAVSRIILERRARPGDTVLLTVDDGRLSTAVRPSPTAEARG